MPVPYRLGTTSYIIPADIAPNVRHLAGTVRDIELVIFEVDDGQNNLPAVEVIDELVEIASRHDLSYTVHLPLDLRLGADGDEGHASVAKALAVIERTRPLEPWAWIVHLDGREVRVDPEPEDLERWQAHTRRALEIVAAATGAPERLAVENLETYPPDFVNPVIEGLPVSRCVDIGHLWKDGHDAIPYLRAALPRTRVIHLHGMGDRDHRSLAVMPDAPVVAVLDELARADYRGVLTLEIFGEEDFAGSMAMLARLGVTP
jgi:sugar phosphate isomerase/epimerase